MRVCVCVLGHAALGESDNIQSMRQVRVCVRVLCEWVHVAMCVLCVLDLHMNTCGACVAAIWLTAKGRRGHRAHRDGAMAHAARGGAAAGRAQQDFLLPFNYIAILSYLALLIAPAWVGLGSQPTLLRFICFFLLVSCYVACV